MNIRLRGAIAGPHDRVLVIAMLAICLFFLSLSGISLFTLDRIKYGIRATAGPVTFDLLWHLSRSLDFVFPALAGLAGVSMVLVEWRDRGFSRLIGGRFPAGLVPVSVCALVWFGHAILAPGLIVTGDAGTHVARVNHLAMAIEDGSSLFWDNYFFGGSTLLQFTGPVFHWMAAGVELVVQDPTQAVKYTAFLARLAAAMFMYAYARRIGGGRPAAMITALFYAGSYFVTYMEIIRSSFPQLVNFAAMPAILYFAEGVLIAPSALGPASIGLALSATVFVGSHQPTAAIFALFAAAYVVVRLTMLGWPMTALRGLLVAGIGSALGSIYFLAPFALERSMTADNFSAGSLVTLAWPHLAMLRNVFVWGRTGLGAEYSTYFGLPMMLCAASGVWVIAVRRDLKLQTLARFLVLNLVLALITLFVRGAYVRDATLTFCFLCAAAGAGLQMLLAAFPRVRGLPALVFILVVLDAGPSAIQPWTREDLRPLERAGQRLAAATPNQRILEITFDGDKPVASVEPTSTPLAEARIQTLNGPHKQDATPAHNAFAATLKIAEDDLRKEHGLTASTATMLAVLNVGWCVGVGERAMGLPDWIAADQTDPVFGRLSRLAGATPVLASGTLELERRPVSFDAPPFWQIAFSDVHSGAADAKQAIVEIARRMDIDLSARRAARFLVPRIPGGVEWNSGGGQAPEIIVSHYTVSPGGVRIILEADHGGFVRLAHPLTPNTRVTRNGVIVAAIPDVEALAVLPVQPGTNDIVLVWMPSVLRQICFWTSTIASGIMLCLLLAMGLRSWRVAQPAKH